MAQQTPRVPGPLQESVAAVPQQGAGQRPLQQARQRRWVGNSGYVFYPINGGELRTNLGDQFYTNSGGESKTNLGGEWTNNGAKFYPNNGGESKTQRR